MHDITKFIAGFKRFQENYFCVDEKLFTVLRDGQKPRVLVIACSDSRVDPAILTDCAPGDLFVIRNVASLIPPYERDMGHHGVSAALEFAVKGLEVQHIIIMGHGHCGGIQALMRGETGQERFEFVSRWVDIAAPAKRKVLEDLPEKSAQTQQKACEQASVLLSLENLLTFPWIRERVDAGQILLHGWYFDLEKGELLGYLPQTASFEPLVPRCA